MIDDLVFPKGKSLKQKPKVIPAEAYLEWVIENVRHLHATGRLEQILRSPTRRPANVPFTL